MEKIIENGIKPFLSSLVLPNQGGFVENRQISENIILVQEAIHSIYSRGEKGMVIKNDMENVFDKVWHSFLRDILKKFDLIGPLSLVLEPVSIILGFLLWLMADFLLSLRLLGGRDRNSQYPP